MNPLVRREVLQQTLTGLGQSQKAIPLSGGRSAPRMADRNDSGAGEDPLPTSDTTPDQDAGAVSPRILLVEDTSVNQKLALRFLHKLHCHADVAANGREAVRMTAERDYDLVLMDCHMPEMDGYEAARVIREREENDPESAGRLPIVAFTASVLPEDQERCFAAGMDDFLSKPFKLSELRGAVEKWRGSTGAGRKAA